jgi:putative Mg2+ transporter-C (MgtC) family protein
LTGLTTSAGIWLAAGVGMAMGFSFYLLAVAATLLTLIIFTLLWYLERYFEHERI